MCPGRGCARPQQTLPTSVNTCTYRATSPGVHQWPAAEPGVVGRLESQVLWFLVGMGRLCASGGKDFRSPQNSGPVPVATQCGSTWPSRRMGGVGARGSWGRTQEMGGWPFLGGCLWEDLGLKTGLMANSTSCCPRSQGSL